MTGAGEARSIDDFSVGDHAHLERVIGPDEVDAFARLTGDDNPVHMDERRAAELRLGGRVVHGMLTASYVSTVIGTMLPGPGALWMSERFEFRAPVRVGDRIRVEVTVRHVSPATRMLVLDVRVTNQHAKVVMDGEAKVQILERVNELTDRAQNAATAVVTGSGRGIGAAIARRLAADGLQVIVNYRRDEAAASGTVEAIRAAGGAATAYQADVTDAGQATALMDFAADTYGSVDALVNNAGGAMNPRPLRELTWADMEEQLATHLRASYLCVAATLPGMLERGFGRIVNVTSQSAYGPPPPKLTAYVVAKAAQAAFTRCIALEAGPSGVTANAVAPGMTETDLVSDTPARARLALAAQAPLRRLAHVDDIAAAVSFLVGPQGGFVTGQTIHLSGGSVMS